MKILPALVFLAFFFGKLTAQHRCATPAFHAQFSNEDDLRREEAQIERWIAENRLKSAPRAVVTIPVVVHVVYNLDVENVPDETIFSQINALNRDFRRLNIDTARTPSVFKSSAADVEVEFCLASRDPFGRVTNGITRTKTSKTDFSLDIGSVKSPNYGGKLGWNPQRYLNIWVCNLANLTLGFATYPTELATNPSNDGVVVHYQVFGSSADVPGSRGLGRTTTHEVGHWLNLLHLWGDVTMSGCVGRTDFVDDTPNQIRASEGCPSFPKLDNCTLSGNGVMFMNYMDYSADLCMNMFTRGQKERMLAALNLYRAQILTSQGCLTTATDALGELSFSVSPNPTTEGSVWVQMGEVDTYKILIINAVGQVVSAFSVNDSQAQLDVAHLPQGVYLVRVESARSVGVQRLVKN